MDENIKFFIQEVTKGVIIILLLYTMFVVGNYNAYYIREEVKEYCGDNVVYNTAYGGVSVALARKPPNLNPNYFLNENETIGGVNASIRQSRG